MEGINSKNLQDLLKFAIKHQKDGVQTTTEVDTEKKVFLENVLNSMTVNVMEELLAAIHILGNASSSEDEKAECLMVIRDYVDSIDFANSFVKIGGSDVLLKCVKENTTAVRANALNVIGELTQNNPDCQQHFMGYDTVRLLVSYLSDTNDQVLASALYALSSLVGNFESASTEFISCSGPSAVLKCLNTDSSRVFTKACFLISTLSNQFSTVRTEFVNLRSFEILAGNLEPVTDFDVKAEALLVAMATMTESKQRKLDANVCRDVADILKSTLKNIKGLPQCEEMVQYSNNILTNLN